MTNTREDYEKYYEALDFLKKFNEEKKIEFVEQLFGSIPDLVDLYIEYKTKKIIRETINIDV